MGFAPVELGGGGGGFEGGPGGGKGGAGEGGELGGEGGEEEDFLVLEGGEGEGGVGEWVLEDAGFGGYQEFLVGGGDVEGLVDLVAQVGDCGVFGEG